MSQRQPIDLFAGAVMVILCLTITLFHQLLGAGVPATTVALTLGVTAFLAKSGRAATRLALRWQGKWLWTHSAAI
jgi:hypothetical protein